MSSSCPIILDPAPARRPAFRRNTSTVGGFHLHRDFHLAQPLAQFLRPRVGIFNQPELVRVHDFLVPENGKAIPYGVYDLARNEGWVSIGIDHDTATFAVESIRRWWRTMGRPVYRKASRLLITADSGGSNGSRTRLWKWELQRLADETGLSTSVCHFPPGTSKWNKMEHRLLSFTPRDKRFPTHKWPPST